MTTKINRRISTKLDKPVLVAEIERRMQIRVPTIESRRKSCLWYAFETVALLYQHDIRAILQAGSASWKIVPDELDDGVSPTHYSYVYEGVTQETLTDILMTGKLLEIHIWAAIPSTNEVIDLTTKYIHDLAKIAGYDNKVEQPDYVWEDVQQLTTKGIYYQPNEEATKLAMFLIEQGIGG